MNKKEGLVMKEMVVEKVVELHQEFEELSYARVSCDLNYQKEHNGVRAIGCINLTGVGIRNGLEHDIKENIELDILAPYDKLENNNYFHVDLQHYNCVLKQNEIDVTLHFIVDGLLELTLQEDKCEEIIDAPITIEEEKVETCNLDEEATIEDLLSDDDNIKVNQSYVVAQMNDTYKTIAERYQVSEKELILKNNNKNVEFKTLLLLP